MFSGEKTTPPNKRKPAAVRRVGGRLIGEENNKRKHLENASLFDLPSTATFHFCKSVFLYVVTRALEKPTKDGDFPRADGFLQAFSNGADVCVRGGQENPTLEFTASRPNGERFEAKLQGFNDLQAEIKALSKLDRRFLIKAFVFFIAFLYQHRSVKKPLVIRKADFLKMADSLGVAKPTTAPLVVVAHFLEKLTFNYKALIQKCEILKPARKTLGIRFTACEGMWIDSFFEFKTTNKKAVFNLKNKDFLAWLALTWQARLGHESIRVEKIMAAAGYADPAKTNHFAYYRDALLKALNAIEDVAGFKFEAIDTKGTAFFTENLVFEAPAGVHRKRGKPKIAVDNTEAGEKDSHKSVPESENGSAIVKTPAEPLITPVTARDLPAYNQVLTEYRPTSLNDALRFRALLQAMQKPTKDACYA